MKDYEWIIVGGGIAGVSIAEILSRDNKSVLLLEKNDSLASETSKEFHEWFHSGTLHTLVPDNLLTLRYLLGATDDLLEYYRGFQSMNLEPTEAGLSIKEPGWFYNNHINYKYRIHKFNPVWMSMVSKSANLTERVLNHDWLRRRAGAEYGSSQSNKSEWFDLISEQLRSSEEFKTIVSPDITMNSRKLISDMLSHAIENGVDVRTNEEVISIDEKDNCVEVTTKQQCYKGSKIVICAPDLIAKSYDIPIKESYAPMAIVENLDPDQESFVELDYYVTKCINLLVKPGQIGQAGGISLSKESKVKDYLEYLIKEHKKRSPEIKVVDTYVGLKKELVQKGEARNYLYHINNPSDSDKVWTVVLGKFSLAFSMAPEFFRRVYKKNPKKSFKPNVSSSDKNLVSKTSWQEIIERNN
tara:strand:+ start:1812 stop:3050 length:1239 start_codon:yes stop_codon:yes gene_type:complete